MFRTKINIIKTKKNGMDYYHGPEIPGPTTSWRGKATLPSSLGPALLSVLAWNQKTDKAGCGIADYINLYVKSGDAIEVDMEIHTMQTNIFDEGKAIKKTNGETITILTTIFHIIKIHSKTYGQGE